MSLVTRVCNSVMWWKKAPQQNEIANSENPLKEWSFLIVSMLRILLWENVTNSLSFLLLVNAIFWSVVHSEIRLYGILFFILFLLSVGDFVMNQGLTGPGRGSSFLWPFAVTADVPEASSADQQLPLLTAEEVSERFREISGIIYDFYLDNVKLRRESPFAFLVRWTGFCLILIGIGLSFSGVTIIYVILMTIMLGPAVYLNLIANSQSDSDATCGDVDLKDYWPEPMRPFDDGIDPLNEPEVVSSNEPAEESSLYPDLSSMPNYDQSLDYLEPDQPIPSPRQIDQEESDDSDISLDIQIKTRHFNGDGSSSSGEEMSKGLRFRRSVPRDASPPPSSDDDFEFVSKDDLM